MAIAQSTYAGNSKYRLQLEVIQSSQNIVNNTSTMTWYLRGIRDNPSGYPGAFNNSATSWSVNIGGQAYSGSVPSFRFNTTQGHTIQWASGTTVITHDASGAKSISFSGSHNSGPAMGNASVSNSMNLTTIPRQSIVTSVSRTSYTCLSIGATITADKAFNSIRYGAVGGNWTTVAVGSRTSHTQNMPGFSPATSVHLMFQVRNTASGLWSNSYNIWMATARLPTVNAPSVTFTSTTNPVVTYTFSKELAAQEVIPYLYVKNSAGGNVQVAAGSWTSANTYSFTISNAVKTSILAASPNHTSRLMWVYFTTRQGGVTQGAVTGPSGTVTIGSGYNPTFSNFWVENITASVTSVLGVSNVLVQGISSAQLTIQNMSCSYGTTLESATFSIGGKESKITLPASTTATGQKIVIAAQPAAANGNGSITVRDRRGFAHTMSVGFNALPYQRPSITNLTPNRLHGYEQQSYLSAVLTASALSLSNVAKNGLTIHYRIKLNPSGAFGAWQVVTGTQTVSGQTLTYRINQYINSFPNTNEYTVELRVTDRMTSGQYTTMSAILKKGQGLFRFKEDVIEAGVPVDMEWRVKDTRDTDPTPAQLTDRTISPYFNNKYGTIWQSGISVKGWTGAYQAWQLGSSATSSNINEGLRYRIGAGATWNPWRHVALQTTDHYPKMMSGGSTTEWMSTTLNGLLPHVSNPTAGSSYLGTISWPFKEVHTKQLFLAGGRLADYVIEQGTFYTKWNSGRLEQWGSVTVNPVYNSAWGSLHYYNTTLGNFPIPFTSITVCVRTLKGSSALWIEGGFSDYTNTSLGGGRLVHAASGMTTSISYSYYAIGRWK